MNTKKKIDTYRLTLLGILTAIIAVQSFVPFLGLIPIQPFNPTIIHITVIIGAVVMGPMDGAILGLIWGLLVMLRAWVLPTSIIDPIIFTNPLVAVFPRILIGIFSGYTFIAMKNRFSVRIAAITAGIVGSFTNTIFVLGMIYLLYRVPYANFYKIDVSKVLPIFMGVIATNGVIEAILAGIITPIVAIPLLKIYRK